MSNYPPFEGILAYIVESLRNSNKSDVALVKLKRDFAKKYSIENQDYCSVVDKYICDVNDNQQSDLLSYVFILATNILLGTGIITGQTSYRIINDSMLPMPLSEITYDMLKNTGKYNLCLLALLSEVIHESFYYSTDSGSQFIHDNVIVDLTYSIQSINRACYHKVGNYFLDNLSSDLNKLFQHAYGNDLVDKNNVKEDLIYKLRNLSPLGFEKFCLIFLSEILSYNGGDVVVNHLGKSGDNGFDGVLINKNILDGDAVYYIQCKRYKKTNIQRSEVQSFIGAMSDKTISANRGVFMTTSKFAKGAKEFSSNSIKQIRLFDIDEIVLLMVNRQIGLKPVSNNILLKIDEEFFSQFSSS